jgi:hypothetical protein
MMPRNTGSSASAKVTVIGDLFKQTRATPLASIDPPAPVLMMMSELRLIERSGKSYV